MPNDPKGQNNRILAGVLKFAVPAVFVLGAIWVTSLFEPDPIDLDKAIDEAYEVAEIDLAYLRWSKDTDFLCFENPTSRDELFECGMNGPMLNLNIKGTLLDCQAGRPSYTQILSPTSVTMSCQAEDGPSHGLPRYYKLTSFTDIPYGDFGTAAWSSSADENGNYLQPVLFGIEPVEEIVPTE